MNDYKLRFADKAEADLILEPILNQLRIGDYHRHDIGIHTECLQFDEESGECLQTEIWDGWHVDVRSTVKLDIPVIYQKQPKHNEQIHAFA